MSAKRITAFVLTLALAVTLLPAVPVSAAQAQENNHVFALEIVTGADGLDLDKAKGSTARITYRPKEGNHKNVTFDLVEAYDLWNNRTASTNGWNFEDGNAGYGRYSTDPTEWLDQNVLGMGYLSTHIVTDGFTAKDTVFPDEYKVLQPYSSTTFFFSLPTTEATIMKIRLELKGSDSVDIQQMRVYHVANIQTASDASGRGYTDHYNGGFTPQIILPWIGRLYAQTTGKTISVPAAGAVTYSIYPNPDNYRLVKTTGKGLLGGNWSVKDPNYGDYGLRISDASTGSNALDSSLYANAELGKSAMGVGVALQFADFAGAGIDALLLGAGEDPYGRVYRYDECMDLEVTYKDTFGNTRRVNIPFLSLYLMYNIFLNGDLRIHGFMQPDETAAVPFLLHQYDELIAIKLRYGTDVRPEWSQSWKPGVDFRTGVYQPITNDPITLDGISFYENVTQKAGIDSNNNKYAEFVMHADQTHSTPRKIIDLKTILSPAYSVALGTGSGQQISNGSVEGKVSDGTLVWGGLPPRSHEDRYLISITNSAEEGAGTESPSSVRLEYIDTSGNVQNTELYSVPDLVSSFYGLDSYGSGSIVEYRNHTKHAGARTDFIVEIPNVESFESIDLSLGGDDEWQIDKIEISAVESLGFHYWATAGSGFQKQRDVVRGETLASVSQTFLFQQGQRRVITFAQSTGAPIEGDGTTPLPSGEKDTYLTTIPLSMTFEEASGQLGIGIAKHTYDVIVNVADEVDAGSANHFYFQLVFENGTSGFVLANQQLASDSFKQGCAEVFRIRTTMNYGDLTAVNIVCDNTAAEGTVFDKLNIDSITVAMTTTGGLSKSWKVDAVGWIDINYSDAGNIYDAEETDGDGNMEIIRRYPITSRGTAVQIQLCITTASGSGYTPALNDTGTRAELLYTDYYGVERSFELDLNKYIRDYSNNKTTSIFRAGKTDRLTVTLDNVVSLKSIRFSRIGEGTSDWLIGGVAAQIVGELGAPYLAGGEYIRSGGAANEVKPFATGNIEGSVKVGVKGSSVVIFKDNKLEVDPESFDVASVSTPETQGERETIHVYVDLGPVGGTVYGELKGAVKYYELASSKYKQAAFESLEKQVYNGREYMCAKVEVSAVSSICSVVLADGKDYSRVCGVSIYRRGSDGTILDAAYANFGQNYVRTTPYEVLTKDIYSTDPYDKASTGQTFTVQLQPESGTLDAVIADAGMLEVAMLYEGIFDLGGGLRTPFQTLDELGCAVVENDTLIELTADVPACHHITGIAFRGVDGTEYRFVNARAGAAKSKTFDSHVTTPFVINSSEAVMVDAVYGDAANAVVKISVILQSAYADDMPDAGSTSPVAMELTYTDVFGRQQSFVTADLRGYMSEANRVFDETTNLHLANVYLNAPAAINTVTLTSSDDWFLECVNISKANAADPLGRLPVSYMYVYRWVDADSLTVDMRGEQNKLEKLTVSAESSGTGNSASAYTYSNTKELAINAYAGDTVTIDAEIKKTGSPEDGLVWNGGQTESESGFAINGSTARFTVPGDAMAGNSYTFSVCCAGNWKMHVDVTVNVIERPAPEPEPDWGEPDSGEAPALPSADATAPSGAELPTGTGGDGSLSVEVS